MRRGLSQVEMMMVLAIVGILAGMSLPRVAAMRDGAAVHSAASELRAALTTARQTAIARGRIVAVLLADSAPAGIVVASGTDTILSRPVGAEHRVTLDVTRDSIAYGPTGRGYGAANTRIIVRRGRSADTIFVSRLGRARH
jgi:prepilin-type N-terminal cleavage/methylation domain-containing protein